jgi:hypothetical protein
MNYIPKKVSVKDLINKNEKRVKQKLNVKNMFLEKCHIRIESHNSFGQEDLLFEVPPFVIGLPPYSREDILEYLLESLGEDGFYVIHVPKTYSIYISWKKKDIDKMKNKKEGFLTLNKNGFFDNLPINPHAVKHS